MVRSGGKLRHVGGEGVEVRHVGGEVCGLGLSVESSLAVFCCVYFMNLVCALQDGSDCKKWRRL